MEDTLVSIVVPIFNKSRFLHETVESVQRQTYRNWELLLVDDCSTDDSLRLARKMAKGDHRIRSLCQEQNQGAARARNRGVQEAQGRFLCYLDADDIWLPEKLERELDFIREKQAGFVFTGYEFADEEGKGLGKIVHVPAEITYEEALKNTTIFTSAVMLDRKIVAQEDAYMPDVPSEDTATWWNLLKKYEKGYGLDENLVLYRRSAKTLSSNKVEAIRRIWGLYRRQEKLSVIKSLYCTAWWAWRAVARRI